MLGLSRLKGACIPNQWPALRTNKIIALETMQVNHFFLIFSRSKGLTILPGLCLETWVYAGVTIKTSRGDRLHKSIAL